jgi:hypothetical protein
VLQSYAAFDGYLDGLNAAWYDGPAAPDFVIYAHGTTDDRYVFFDEPQTKLAMLRRYEVSEPDSPYWALLRRRDTPRALRTVPGPTGTIAIGAPLVLEPAPGEMVLARFEIVPSFAGRLARLLYRPRGLRLRFDLEDGTSHVGRAIPAVMASGVPIGRYVATLDHAKRYFDGDLEALPPVRQVRFDTDDPWAFRPDVGYSLSAVSVDPGGQAGSAAR